MPTAETPDQALQPHRGRYKQLTNEQRIAASQLASLGKTQIEIAQTLGCHQSSVSRWLGQCQDTTGLATAYLRGQALRVARRLIDKGTPATDAVVLKGVSALQEQQHVGVQVFVGGSGQVNIGIGLSPVPVQVQGEGERKAQQTLAQSDNQSYVNQTKLLTGLE